MMGMEKMLASMIGLTPDQMKAKVGEFESFVSDGSKALVSIAETQKEILARLERIENGPGK